MEKRKEKEIWLLNVSLKTACKDKISSNGEVLYSNYYHTSVFCLTLKVTRLTSFLPPVVSFS